MSPTVEQVADYARLAEAGAGLLARLAALFRGGPQAQASRLRRRALRKLRRADRIVARAGRLTLVLALRRDAQALLAEAEALWPIGEEIAALRAPSGGRA